MTALRKEKKGGDVLDLRAWLLPSKRNESPNTKHWPGGNQGNLGRRVVESGLNVNPSLRQRQKMI